MEHSDGTGTVQPQGAGALEGRLLAHRRVLGLIVQTLAEPQRAALRDWLAGNSVLHDGQEDPGAVPTEANAIALAVADEYRLLAEMLARPDQLNR